MSKKIILILSGLFLAGIVGSLGYLKIIHEPKPAVVHKIVKADQEKNDESKNPTSGVIITNADKFPYFKKYEASVLPFIQSQYNSSYLAKITLTDVVMDNWHMQIFYNAHVIRPNGTTYNQTDLNYSNVVRQNVPIPKVSSYSKTNSDITGSHYTIPAGTIDLTITANGQQHIQFLVNGTGVCNTYPDVTKDLKFNSLTSNDNYDSSDDTSNAPTIYSIIDNEGVGRDGYFNAGAATTKYNLKATPIEAIKKNVVVPAGSVMYTLPSEFSSKIVTTNKTTLAAATYSVVTSGQYTMYLVNIQGQEGWVKIA